MGDDVSPVVAALQHSLLPEQQARLSAEQALRDLELSGGPYLVLLFRVVVDTGLDIDGAVRQAGAIALKNLVARRWEAGTREAPLPEAEKAIVRQNLLEGLIHASAPVRVQLGLVFKSACYVDFPHAWSGLLDELLRNLQAGEQRTYGALYAQRMLVKKCAPGGARPRRAIPRRTWQPRPAATLSRACVGPRRRARPQVRVQIGRRPRAAAADRAAHVRPAALRVWRFGAVGGRGCLRRGAATLQDLLVDHPGKGARTAAHMDVAVRAQPLRWLTRAPPAPAWCPLLAAGLQSSLPEELSRPWEGGQLSAWMAQIVALLERPVPPALQPADADGVGENPAWKAKKWAAHILHRMLQRYGNPRYARDEGQKQLAHFLLAQYAPRCLGAALALLSHKSAGAPCSPRVETLCLNFVGEAIGHASLYRAVRPQLEGLLVRIVFPQLCFSQAELELWREEPAEFVRKELDVLEEFYSPKVRGAAERSGVKGAIGGEALGWPRAPHSGPKSASASPACRAGGGGQPPHRPGAQEAQGHAPPLPRLLRPAARAGGRGRAGRAGLCGAARRFRRALAQGRRAARARRAGARAAQEGGRRALRHAARADGARRRARARAAAGGRAAGAPRPPLSRPLPPPRARRPQVKAHVAPELRSSVGFMRARACAVYARLYRSMQFRDEAHFAESAAALLGCLRDAELPVRVHAAMALQHLLNKEQAAAMLRPRVAELCELLFSLMNDIGHEEVRAGRRPRAGRRGRAAPPARAHGCPRPPPLRAPQVVSALDALIGRFAAEMCPHAVSVVSSLVGLFGRMLDEGDEDEDSVRSSHASARRHAPPARSRLFSGAARLIVPRRCSRRCR